MCLIFGLEFLKASMKQIVPVVIRKIGRWTGSIKKYFSDIHKDVTDLQDSIEDEIEIENKYSKNKTVNKENE